MFTTNKRSEQPTLTYIRCRVGGRDYALDIISILDIQPATSLTVDLQNSAQVGWVKALGQETPIYDLAGRLRLKRPRFNPSQQRIILFNAQPNFGLLVESVSQATEVRPERVYGLPKFARNLEKDYFSGVVVTADGLLPLLNPHKILPFLNSEPLRKAQWPLLPPTVADLQAQQIETLSSSTEPSLATFTLAEQEFAQQPLLYGFSGTQILEIIPPSFITALPGSPHHLIGLTQWQDMALPLIDIGALLGRKESLTLTKQRDYRFVLARDAHEQLACLCVQADVAVNPLVGDGTPSLHEMPYQHPAVRGMFDIGQQTIAMLDTTRLWAM